MAHDGKHPKLTSELARRFIRVRLDPGVDRPWQRTGFRHEDLSGWVQDNRGVLVRACLILIQHWIASGRKPSSSVLGSFENWAKVIGGVLAAAGITDFLGNLEDMYAAVDAEGEAWREFVEIWRQEFGSSSVRVHELNTMCQKHSLLMLQRGDGTPQSQLTKLGFALADATDRVINGLKINLLHDKGHKGKIYVLLPQLVTQLKSSPSGQT